MKRNIFIVGLDEFHLKQLQALPCADEYIFYPLFSRAEIGYGGDISIKWLLEEGEARLKAFPDKVDAIVGYTDFPVSTILPVLRQKAGLPTTSLESVLKCDHKYWSRLEQAHSILTHIPSYCVIDPFEQDPFSRVELEFPFWIKPVKAALSYLGFLVTNREEFDYGIAATRQGIGQFA